MERPPLRDREQVQFAHDIFHAIVVGEIPNPFNNVAFDEVRSVHDCLSWALQFDCGDAFAKNLRGGVEELLKMGYDVMRVQ